MVERWVLRKPVCVCLVIPMCGHGCGGRGDTAFVGCRFRMGLLARKDRQIGII